MALFAAVVLATGVTLAAAAFPQPAYADDAIAISASNANAQIQLSLDEAGKQPLADGATVSPNTTIYGSLRIDFKPDDQPSAARSHYAYELPAELRDVAATVMNGDLMDGTTVAGAWRIDANTIDFTYNADYLASHSSNIYALFNFHFKIQATEDEYGQSKSISFPAVPTPVKVVPVGESTSSKAIVKEADGTTVKINASNEIEYVLTVVTAADTAKLKLVDTLSYYATFVAGSFEFDGQAVAPSIAAAPSNATEATLSINDVPAGTHTLTYRAKLRNAAITSLNNGATIPLTNRATWSLDGTDLPTKTVSSMLYHTAVSKQQSASGSTVTWKARINYGTYKRDLGGYRYTDTLVGAHEYEGTVQVKNEAGDVVDEFAVDTSARSFSYDFPADAGKAQYTFEYKTTRTADADSGYANRGVLVDSDMKEAGRDIEGTVGPGTFIRKSVEDKSQVDDTGEVTWKTTLKAGWYESPETTAIDDAPAVAGSFEYYTTGEKAPKVTTAAGATLVEGTDYVLVWKDEANGRAKGFELKFKATTTTQAAFASDIYLTYTTVCDPDVIGTFTNRIGADLGVIKTYDEDSFTVGKPQLRKQSPKLEKTAPGEWIADWQLEVNGTKNGHDYDSRHGGFQPLQKSMVGIVDDLPAGMTFVPGTLEVTAVHLRGSSVEGVGPIKDDSSRSSGITGMGNSFKVEPSASGGQTMRLELNSANWGSANATDSKWYIVVKYQTKISADLAAGESRTFENSVAASVGGDDGADLGSATGQVTVSDAPVEKSSQHGDGATNEYTVKVNELARDLAQGDTLELWDVLDPATTLVAGSFKVTDADGADITDQCSVKLSEAEGESGAATTKMTVTVPDGTFVTVAYKCQVEGEVGETVPISNTAGLSGVQNSSTSCDDEFRVARASGTTGGASGKIVITKVDAAHPNKTLDGAKFELYRVDLSSLDGAGEVTDEQVAAASAKVAEGVTESGSVTLGDENAGDSRELMKDALYYYVEVAAPTGYELDSAPHYFMLRGTQYESQLERVKALGIAPSANAQYTAYDEESDEPDEPEPELSGQIVLAAQKKLVGGDLSAGAFSFELRDAAGEVLQTKTNDAQGKVDFDPIALTADDAGATYAFTIHEVPGDQERMTYADDQQVEVAVCTAEDAVDGVLTCTYGGSDTLTAPTFTNVLAPEPQKVSVTVTKKWDDADDQDGARPASVTMRLLAAGEDTGQTVKLDADNKWKASFDDLPKVGSDGADIAYTVVEDDDDLDGYTPSTEGSLEAGFTITNVRKPATVDVKGQKVWDDEDDADGSRPESITVVLLADGQKVDSVEVKPDAKGDWKFEFTDLPKFGKGKEIEYTVDEEDVPEGYEKSVKSTTITNKHEPVAPEPELTSVDVSKTWDDADDQDGMRPDSVTVRLLADGQDTGKSAELTADGGWKATFEDLPETSDGAAIAYTVAEDVPEGYTCTQSGSAADGYVLTNTHAPATVAIAGSKVWSDSNDADGLRPASVTVNLLADGKVVDSAKVTATNGAWNFQFTGLPKYSAGKEISYTVDEPDVPSGYTKKVSGMVITNSHTPKTTTGDSDKPDVTTPTTDDDGPQTPTTPTTPSNPSVTPTTPTTPSNSYTAASVVLKARKVLNGATLTAGQFSFRLLDANGTVLQTKTNAADGSVTFDALSLSAAGTTTYQINEVQGTNAGYTYDTHSSKVTVTVTADAANKAYVATVSYDGSAVAPTFTNTYKQTTTAAPTGTTAPGSTVAQTGDHTAALVAGIVAVLVIAAAAMVVARRRMKK